MSDGHDELRDLLGAYALDALEAEEVATLERHLEGCDACRLEVTRHRETAAWLASVAAPEPPERVWDRIADRTVRGADTDEPRAPLLLRPRSTVRWKVATAVTSVAAAAATIVAIGSVAEERDLAERVDDLAATVESVGLRQAAANAALDPDARTVVLRSPDETASARLVYLPDGTGYLVEHDLADLAGDRTYQLWALVGDRKISAGVLGSEPAVTPFQVAGPVDGFALTVETAGGAVAPSGDPVVVGFLS
ncbi:MAG TPA: anti-sigma factor [Acidimicrobiia bacterium]|nr:anti-sigma factor [Acidimicrobiia bacterium]